MWRKNLVTAITLSATLAVAVSCGNEPDAPAGGGIYNPSAEGCDTDLQSDLVSQKGTRSAADAQETIRRVHETSAHGCETEVWDPEVTQQQECRAEAGDTIAEVEVPHSLAAAMRAPDAEGLTRDPDGNIMVSFRKERTQANTANCWMYVANAGIWVSTDTGPEPPEQGPTPTRARTATPIPSPTTTPSPTPPATAQPTGEPTAEPAGQSTIGPALQDTLRRYQKQASLDRAAGRTPDFVTVDVAISFDREEHHGWLVHMVNTHNYGESVVHADAANGTDIWWTAVDLRVIPQIAETKGVSLVELIPEGTPLRWKEQYARMIAPGTATRWTDLGANMQDGVASRTPHVGTFIRPAPLQPSEEDETRCQEWATASMDAETLREFRRTDPATMDDEERARWLEEINRLWELGHYAEVEDLEPGARLTPDGPAMWCRAYWSQPAGPANWHKRNVGSEADCKDTLIELAGDEFINMRGHFWGAPEMYHHWQWRPNHWVSMLKMMEMSPEELASQDDPMHERIRRHAGAHWAHASMSRLSFKHPWRLGLDNTREDLANVSLIWAAGLTSKTRWTMGSCHMYFPQLFYGVWAPLEVSPGNARHVDLEETSEYYPRPGERQPKYAAYGWPIGGEALCDPLTRTSWYGHELRYDRHGHPYCVRNDPRTDVRTHKISNAPPDISSAGIPELIWVSVGHGLSALTTPRMAKALEKVALIGVVWEAPRRGMQGDTVNLMTMIRETDRTALREELEQSAQADVYIKTAPWSAGAGTAMTLAEIREWEEQNGTAAVLLIMEYENDWRGDASQEVDTILTAASLEHRVYQIAETDQDLWAVAIITDQDRARELIEAEKATEKRTLVAHSTHSIAGLSGQGNGTRTMVYQK